MKPYARKQYWNQPTMSWWERAYLPEILRGLGITGGVFLKNMGRWMTLRKGALTTYYPEETRADYAAGNRGKHVLTQRPDGRPQCIACNMCATVCPAKVIEIEAAFDPDDPAHPKYPARFEIDYSRCIFCGLCVEACPEDAIRMVKEVPDLPTPDRGRLWLSKDELLTWKPQRDVAKPYPAKGGSGATKGAVVIETWLLWLFAGTALAAAALMLVLRHPMRVALALIATMLSLAGVYALLGVHVIAVFQVLIYVGAVMVFMVYVIMLLDVRDRSYTRRFSRCCCPASPRRCCSSRSLATLCGMRFPQPTAQPAAVAFGLQHFSVEFLSEYWLQFELVSVLLVAAVVAALAVLEVGRRHRG